jgi:hypothetical protein
MKPIGLPELPGLRKAVLSWLSFGPLALVKHDYCGLSVTHGRKTPMYWLRRCMRASRSFLGHACQAESRGQGSAGGRQ